MNRFSIAVPILIVTLLVAACMYTLSISLEAPIVPRSRLLFIGNGNGAYWQRAVTGARDAACVLGIDLDVETPLCDGSVDEQTSVVRKINVADYDGVAISPADPVSQNEPINDLASRTKLITIDRDGCKSQRLCHIGYNQMRAGELAARLVCNQLSRAGKVALLATSFCDDARNTNVNERLAGFKEVWGPCGQIDSMPCPIIQVATDPGNLEPASQDLSATVADPELAFIVAFDVRAAESALEALAARSETRHVPIIAFEPNQAIFDAIDDGRVCSAIFDDPYRSGFAAIERLGQYRRADKYSLPMPGCGSIFLASEIVRKENTADIRRRINVTASLNQRSNQQDGTEIAAVFLPPRLPLAKNAVLIARRISPRAVEQLSSVVRYTN